ncbi:unnamed protein product [Boreogadus saida]
MSRKKLAWANKEVETFVCILGEEDVVYDVYVAAAAIDIRPTTKGTVGSGNATSELSWANRSLPTAPLRSDPFRTLQWKCGIGLLRGKVVEPAVRNMDPKEQQELLERIQDTDEEEKYPLLFTFDFQEDMEEVFHNMAAEEDLRVNAMFLGRWVDSQ